MYSLKCMYHTNFKNINIITNKYLKNNNIYKKVYYLREMIGGAMKKWNAKTHLIVKYNIHGQNLPYPTHCRCSWTINHPVTRPHLCLLKLKPATAGLKPATAGLVSCAAMPQLTTALLLCGERTMRAATQNLGLEFEQRNDDLPPSGDGDYSGAEESSLRRRSPERQRQVHGRL